MNMKLIQMTAIAFFALTSCDKSGELADAYGNFEVTPVTISSETNGRLVRLEVTEGGQIEAGKLVAIIDTTQLYLQKLKIEATIQTLPQKLRNTLADIEVLEKQKANLNREYERVKRLLEKKAATSQQLDELQGQLDVIDRQIEAIRAQTNTGNQAILSEKQPMLAQKAILDDKIRRSYIKNPLGGTVLTKLSEAHELVGPGTPLYRIAGLDTMTLRFYVDAVQLQQLSLGQDIEVLVDHGKEGYKQLEGRVSWISDESEFTPKTIQTKKDRVNLVYAVKAVVPNPEGLLKIGMPAEVNFMKTEN
jgi:HlyD family secretion protein